MPVLFYVFNIICFRRSRLKMTLSRLFIFFCGRSLNFCYPIIKQTFTCAYLLSPRYLRKIDFLLHAHLGPAKDCSTKTWVAVFLLFCNQKSLYKHSTFSWTTFNYPKDSSILTMLAVQYPTVTLIVLFWSNCNSISLHLLRTIQYRRADGDKIVLPRVENFTCFAIFLEIKSTC